jgi:hypothetical protein
VRTPDHRRLFKWRCKYHTLFGVNGPVRWWFRDRERRDAAVLAGTEPISTTRDYYRVTNAQASHEWAGEIRQRGRILAGRKVWDDFSADRRWNTCQLLADIANDLVRVRDTAHASTDYLVAVVLRGAPKITRMLAATCVRRLLDLKLGGIPQATDAIRVIGVYVCVLRGRNLKRCHCFGALVASRGRDGAREALQTAFPDLTPTVRCRSRVCGMTVATAVRPCAHVPVARSSER